MVEYREILRQRAMGVSVRNVAFSCKCSTATVRTVADRARACGLEWPLSEEMNDAAIRAAIDHERVSAEMGRPGVTMSV